MSHHIVQPQLHHHTSIICDYAHIATHSTGMFVHMHIWSECGAIQHFWYIRVQTDIDQLIYNVRDIHDVGRHQPG